MNKTYLFPRLPPDAAKARYQCIAGKGIADLCSECSAEDPDAIYAATGGSRISREALQSLRDEVLASVRSLGFPGRGRKDSHADFDGIIARILRRLPIAGGEASRDEVWSFISIVLMPDICTWRFPDQNERRFLGGVRNTFQRLWWRAYLLEDIESEDHFWLLKLPEDALVGLMERPGISANRALARITGQTVSQLIDSLPAGVSESAWRAFYKQIRQRIPLVNFDCLSTIQIVEQLEELRLATIDFFAPDKGVKRSRQVDK